MFVALTGYCKSRVGKINNVTAEELREILGDGNLTITLSLPQE
jgi:hypothetical protein